VNEYLWGMWDRVRVEALLCQAPERRHHISVRSGSGMARFLIRVGRRLERMGERLAGGQAGDMAVGGVR